MTTITDRIAGLNGGIAMKAPVDAATTASITLSGAQTIDGVAVVAGNRVLVKDQSSGVDNGIYVVASGTWTRATDMNGVRDVVSGSGVFVAGGTVNGLRTFYLTSANPVTIGTSALSFSSAASASFATGELVDSRASIVAESVPAVVQHIRTAGYSTVGDGGGALYVRAGSEPVHALKVQSADGAWWSIVPEGGVVRARQAGAVEGGACRSAIQDCIDFVLYGGTSLSWRNDCNRVLIDVVAGTCDGAIHIGYGGTVASTAFRTIIVEGLGPSHNGDVGGTTLTFTHTDEMLVNIQGMRFGQLRNLTLIGVAEAEFLALATTGKAPTLEATWDAALTSAGVTPGERYAPYAGITVDAYGGTKPTAGTGVNPYPDISFGFSGLSTQYGKSSTDTFTIENVVVRGVEVGLVIQPGDVDANGDHVSLYRVHFNYCKIAKSVGNSQARNTDRVDCKFSFIWLMVANNLHGKQIGRLAGVWSGDSVFGFCSELFSINSLNTAGAINWQSLQCESLHRIGDFTGNNTVDGTLAFQSGKIKFRHSDTNGMPPNVLGGDSFGAVTFEEMEFSGYPSVMSMMPERIRMDRCRMSPNDTPSKTYAKIVHNATNGGIVLNMVDNVGCVSAHFRPFDLGTGSQLGESHLTDEGYSLTDRDYLIPVYAGRVLRSGSKTSQRDRVDRPQFYNSDSISGYSASRSDKVVSFTASPATTAQNANQQGYMPGSIVRDRATGTVMAIFSTDTGTGAIEAVLLTNYISDGAGGFDLFDTSFSLSSGTWEFIETKVFTPPYEIVGTISTGAATISSIRLRSSVVGFPTDYGLASGDYLYEDAMSIATFNTTGRALVSGITTGSNLITMSGNADTSVTDLEFPAWIKVAPSNEATP